MALPPRSKVSPELAVEIKAALWEGGTIQSEIAEQAGVSQGTISNILRGYVWPHAKWPDGSMGAMPVMRYEHINWAHGMSRWKRTTAYKEAHKPSTEMAKAEVALKEIERRQDLGESLDDIIDENGNFLPSDKKTID